MSSLEDYEWPGLKWVDVPKSHRVYKNRDAESLLLNRQVIKSRDPRLSTDLAKSSVYFGLSESPQEPDDEENIQRSSNSKRIPSEVVVLVSPASPPMSPDETPQEPPSSTKVHVNPKFLNKFISPGDAKQDDKESLEKIDSGKRGAEIIPIGAFEDDDILNMNTGDTRKSKKGSSRNRHYESDEDEAPKRVVGKDRKEKQDRQGAKPKLSISSDDILALNEQKDKKKDISPDIDDEEILYQQLLAQTYSRHKKEGKEIKPIEIIQKVVEDDDEDEEGLIKSSPEASPVKQLPNDSHKGAEIREVDVKAALERPSSRNSDRSLDSLEMERNRLEEMLIQEQLNETPRSARRSMTPQVQLKHTDEGHVANKDIKSKDVPDKAAKPNIPLRSAPNRTSDIVDVEQDRREALRLKMMNFAVDEEENIVSSNVEVKPTRKQRDSQMDEFDRLVRLQKLKRFHLQTKKAKELLKPLSLRTCNIAHTKDVSLRKTSYIYKRSATELLNNLDMVYNGEHSRFEKYYDHLGELSIQMQLDADILPFPLSLKRIYRENLQEWMDARPLDGLIVGRLNAASLNSKQLRTSKTTDEISDWCQRALTKNMFHLLQGKKSAVDTTDLIPQPSDRCDLIGNEVFRLFQQTLDPSKKKQESIESELKGIPREIPKPYFAKVETASQPTKVSAISYPHPSSYANRKYPEDEKKTEDMYSPTRPTELEEEAYYGLKRKFSTGEGNDSKKSKSMNKTEKKKAKKRSRSKSKSKERDSKKKKDKKHKKDKKKRRQSKDDDGKHQSGSDMDISPQREKSVSESDPYDSMTVSKIPPPPPQPEIITMRTREQARKAMKRCAGLFFGRRRLLNFANAYGYIPKGERKGLDPIPYPKPTRENTLSMAWCVMEFFMTRKNFTFSDGNKELQQFVLNELDPENGFIWSTLLVLQEAITKDVHDYAEKNRELIMQLESLEAAEKEKEKGVEDISQGKNKKGDNKLLAAFRQALQEKKRQGSGFSSSKTSTLSKLTPEQAAKRPPPKASRILFKPPIAFQIDRGSQDITSGAQREFYSIGDIVKLSDHKLMDELVRKMVLDLLKQTLETNENNDPYLSRDFRDAVQPIVLKQIASIRNLLHISQTFVTLYKEKNQCKADDDDDDEEPNEYGTHANNKPSEEIRVEKDEKASSASSEYGTLPSSLPKQDIKVEWAHTEKVKADPEVAKAFSDATGARDSPKEAVETDDEFMSRRQFRLRKDNTKDRSDNKSKAATEGLNLAEADDEAQQALDRVRKAKEMAASQDARMAAILDEKAPQGSSEDNADSIVIESSGAALPELPDAQDEAKAGDGSDKKQAAKAPSQAMRNANRLLQALKQNKSAAPAQRYASSSNKRVSASDILARLQAKEQTKTQHPKEKENTTPQAMEIEEVSSPRMDENEELYQQALSKDSDSLDLGGTSPVAMDEDSNQLAPPGTEPVVIQEADAPPAKPAAVIGKAAVMYKGAAEAGQGIKSLATAVPNTPSMQSAEEETEATDSQDAASTVASSFSGEAYSSVAPTITANTYTQYAQAYATREYPAASATASTANQYGGYDYSGYSQPSGYDYSGQWAPYQQAWASYYQQQGETAPGYQNWQQWNAWGMGQSGQFHMPPPPIPLPDMSMPPPGFNPSVPPPFMGQRATTPGQKAPLLGTAPPGYGAMPMAYGQEAHMTNVRFYVFNKDNVASRTVETYMKSMGAKTFDPFSIQCTLTQALNVMVFIQRTDTTNIQLIPNFLQLKQEPKIQFILYQSVNDVKYRQYEYVLTQGGVLIADDTIVFETLPETLAEILNYMLEQYTQQGIPWSFKIHRKTLNLVRHKRYGEQVRRAGTEYGAWSRATSANQMSTCDSSTSLYIRYGGGEEQVHCTRVDELMDKYGERGRGAGGTRVRKTFPRPFDRQGFYAAGTPDLPVQNPGTVIRSRYGDGEEQVHCTRVDELMDKYGERGVVEVLEGHECDRGDQPSHCYLACCLRLQALHFQHYRHTLFLTRMPSNEAVACPFLDQGIGVISVEDFITNIVCVPCPEQVLTVTPRTTSKDKLHFLDAIQSTGIDRIDLPEYEAEAYAQLSELEMQAYQDKYYGVPAQSEAAESTEPPGEEGESEPAAPGTTEEPLEGAVGSEGAAGAVEQCQTGVNDGGSAVGVGGETQQGNTVTNSVIAAVPSIEGSQRQPNFQSPMLSTVPDQSGGVLPIPTINPAPELTVPASVPEGTMNYAPECTDKQAATVAPAMLNSEGESLEQQSRTTAMDPTAEGVDGETSPGVCEAARSDVMNADAVAMDETA